MQKLIVLKGISRFSFPALLFSLEMGCYRPSRAIEDVSRWKEVLGAEVMKILI